jgi:hypothetical protein
MVDGLYIPIWNRARKLLAIVLSGVGKGLRRRDDGGNVTNAQYKPNQNCDYVTLSVSWIYPKKHLFKKNRKLQGRGTKSPLKACQ